MYASCRPHTDTGCSPGGKLIEPVTRRDSLQAPFYLGKFPEAAASFSVLNASIVGGVGATSALLGGRLADRLAAKSDTPDAVRMLVRLPRHLLSPPTFQVSWEAL